MGLPFLDNTYDNQHKKLVKMLQMYEKLKEYTDHKQPTLAQDEENKLVRAAQNFAMYTRKLPGASPAINYKAYMKAVYDDTFHITIEVTPEGWLRIKMPPLLPRENGTPWFIRDPLNAKLSEFCNNYEKEHDGKLLSYENGVIICNHHYDKTRPERSLRDIDNYEKNTTFDSVAFYFLPDDGPKYCFHYETVTADEEDFTELFLVPQRSFSKWLENYQLSAE